jgi:hypothetical protein
MEELWVRWNQNWYETCALSFSSALNSWWDEIFTNQKATILNAEVL